jgi:hypothetical protein
MQVNGNIFRLSHLNSKGNNHTMQTAIFSLSYVDIMV